MKKKVTQPQTSQKFTKKSAASCVLPEQRQCLEKALMKVIFVICDYFIRLLRIVTHCVTNYPGVITG